MIDASSVNTLSSSSRMIAADIGGTKSWMCLCEYFDSFGDLKTPKVLYEKIYSSADFSDFSSLLKQFFHDSKVPTDANTIDKMCLALPGVIKDGISHLTNLDWQLDERGLQQQFSIDSVIFMNDFQAAALGVTTLLADDIVLLNPVDSNLSSGSQHEQAKGITVVTGAGTGLGLAWMDCEQQPPQLFSSEGGHWDFAPTNEQQIELLIFLLKQYAHVSYERILSGAGLVQLYRFLSPKNNSEINENDTTTMTQEINRLALQGDAIASSAIDLFVEVYGAYIGNLAVLYKPAGGIYIAGGIATHILPWMQGEKFIKHYFQKGRMRHLAEKTPVYLVINKRLGLQGAIQFGLNNFD